MVGELVGERETYPVGLAVFADHIDAGDLGFFATVLGEGRALQRRPGCDQGLARPLVEPFRLHTGGAVQRLSRLDTHAEHAHGIRLVLAGLLVHLGTSRRRAEMGQPRSGEKKMRRVGVEDGWQNAPLLAERNKVDRTLEPQVEDVILQAQAFGGAMHGQFVERPVGIDLIGLGALARHELDLAFSASEL
jgi:hypothetical protein